MLFNQLGRINKSLTLMESFVRERKVADEALKNVAFKEA
jgi:hypothetical protein